MAFGQGILDAYDSGLQSGRIVAERKKKNLMAEILRQAYEQGTPDSVNVIPNDSDVAGQTERHVPVAGTPGGLNYQKAISMMMDKGLAPEALALEQNKETSDLNKLMKLSQLQNVDAPKTRQVPFGKGMVRTEQWNPKTKVWDKVDEGEKAPLVNVDNKAEGAGLVKLAQEEAQLVSDLKKNAIGGTRLLGPLNRMEQLNATGNVAQGPLANFNQELGKFALYLGAGEDVKKRVAAGEQYFAAAADAVRDKIKALGAGTAVSNVDLLFTRQSVGDLTNTQQGRALIIKAMKADVQNIQNLSKAADTHFRGQGKGSLSGFDPQQHVQILPELSGDQPVEPEAEPTAINKQTGERIVYRNGQWQPLK